MPFGSLERILPVPNNRSEPLNEFLGPPLKCNWSVLVLAVAAAVSTASCGGGSAATLSTPSPAGLSLSTSNLNFGNVPVGSSKSDSLTLTNASNSSSITVTQMTVTGSGFSANSPAMPMVLSAGQSSTMTVSFAPKGGGAASGSLSIVIQGASQPALVPLSGTGVAAGQLAVSPNPMNFGNVNLGSSQNQTGILTAGSSTITVSSAAWNGQGYSVSGITFPRTVAAGQTASFTVTFAPQVAGGSPGSISFVSDASNSPTGVTLTGTGVQPVQHSVSLSWNASTSQVSGYNVYRGPQSSGPYTKLNSALLTVLAFTDGSVQSGSTYYYVATAVDSNNVESGYSNIATAVIP